MKKTRNWIYDLRTRARLTQDDVAQKLKVSTATVCRAETGDDDLSIEQIEQLASLLKMSVADVLQFRATERASYALLEQQSTNQRAMVAAIALNRLGKAKPTVKAKADKTDDEKLQQLADKLGITVEELLKLLPGDMREGESEVRPAPVQQDRKTTTVKASSKPVKAAKPTSKVNTKPAAAKPAKAVKPAAFVPAPANDKNRIFKPSNTPRRGSIVLTRQMVEAAHHKLGQSQAAPKLKPLFTK